MPRTACEFVEVRVPGGLWQGEVRRRDFLLRPVSSEDELFLIDSAERMLPSARATELLRRCLAVDAGLECQDVRRLTVGDREALLLQLRRISVGESIECVLGCPRSECGELLELTLRVDDLLVPAYDDVRRSYEIGARVGDEDYAIRFRLPLAQDLEDAANVARRDRDRGALELLWRCVEHAVRGGEVIPASALSREAGRATAAAMAREDPQAELSLELKCTACAHSFSVVFDTGAFLVSELSQRATRVLLEVHELASHYHWHESDILAMPPRRRAHYLELVRESLRGSRIS